jgi:carboxymethylenebutenolidase
MRSWYQTPGGVPVLRTRPEQPAGRRPILFIHENRGLSPYIMAVLDDLSAEGFETHAPDLLHRLSEREDPMSVTTRHVPEDIHELDLLDVFDTMEVTPVLLGLCFGAEMGWRLAVKRRPGAAALVYGVAPADVSELSCPVFAAYAEDDARVNEGVPELCRQVAAMDVPYRMMSYPGTLHAFHDRTRPERFRAAAADALWSDLLDFLRSHADL